MARLARVLDTSFHQQIWHKLTKTQTKAIFDFNTENIELII